MNALHADINWSVPSLDYWRWLASNPSRPTDAPMGWVIDTRGRIDGFIGCFRQTYVRGQFKFTGATGHSVIVSPRVKGAIRQLIAPFLDQSDLFAITLLNANERGAPVYRRMGMVPYPEQTHAQKLAWITRPALTMASRGLRILIHRWPALVPLVGTRFTPAIASLPDPRQILWPKGVHVITDLSDSSAIGSFWQDLVAQGRLVADRSPATLRWRLRQPDLTMAPLLLAYHDDQGIVAYAMAQMSKTGPVDVPVLEIVDLIALDRAPVQAVPTLIRALQHASRRYGAAKLRLPMLSPDILPKLGRKAATAHTEGGWGHALAHFIAPKENFEDWQPTAFEGSYGFTLPQVQWPKARS